MEEGEEKEEEEEGGAGDEVRADESVETVALRIVRSNTSICFPASSLHRFLKSCVPTSRAAASCIRAMSSSTPWGTGGSTPCGEASFPCGGASFVDVDGEGDVTGVDEEAAEGKMSKDEFVKKYL